VGNDEQLARVGLEGVGAERPDAEEAADVVRSPVRVLEAPPRLGPALEDVRARSSIAAPYSSAEMLDVSEEAGMSRRCAVLQPGSSMPAAYSGPWGAPLPGIPDVLNRTS
jgi:hypothetical protein